MDATLEMQGLQKAACGTCILSQPTMKYRSVNFIRSIVFI